MKKRLLFLLPLALLACRTLFPGGQGTPTQTPIAVATSSLEATAFAPRPDFTLVRIYPKDGALHSLLAAEAKKAQALGQTPFIEFDATWCPPCQAITSSLADKNELMLNAYKGVYLIHTDVDQWGWSNAEAGFTFQAIPVFFKLDQDGKPTGTSIDGGAWGEDIPKNIAPILVEFFHP
jgi:thiol-disulfide isomerase/thioredoxin